MDPAILLLIFFGLVLCSMGSALQENSSHCLSECFYSADISTFNRAGTYCYTSYTDYATCSLRAKLLIKYRYYWISPVYRYRMIEGDDACNGRCGYFGEDYLWCFDTDISSWDNCSESDIIEYEPWQNITKKIKSFIDYHSRLSGACNEIVKNSVGGNSAKEILNVIENEKKFVYHQTYGRKENKIHKIYVPGFNERPETNLTLAISVKINSNHVQVGPASTESPEAIIYYKFLNPGKDDSIGHILPTSLVGIYNFENIVPINFRNTQSNVESDDCDQGVSLKNQIESSITRFLKENQGYVEYDVIVNYGNLPKSLRATHFILRINLKKRDGTPYLNADYPLKGKETFEVLIYNKI